MTGLNRFVGVVGWIHERLFLETAAVVVVMVVATCRSKGQKGNQREEEVDFLHGWFSLWLVCWEGSEDF